MNGDAILIFLGLESFEFRRLAYFAIGAGLFLGFILLVPPDIILSIVPILAVAGFLVVVGLILWQRQSEKSEAHWRAWGRRHRAQAEKGEWTARILGRPDPVFGTRSRPSSIQRSRQLRAKRMMYPVP